MSSISGPADARAVKVDITVATMRRPEWLVQLVAALDAQERHVPYRLDCRVLVVDNDPMGTGCSALMDASYDVDVTCVQEPRPGISAARNRCMQLVREDADYVASIDDDEVPEPNWLQQLVIVAKATGCAAVSGPVVPKPVGPVPRWVRDGGFLHLPPGPDNEAIVLSCFTGNALLAFPRVSHMGPEYFDEALGLSGGEDSDFFRRLRRGGHQIRWAANAVVVEHVPPDRMTARYLVRRKYRIGSTTSVLDKKYAPPQKRAARFATATRDVIIGAVLAPVSALLSRQALVKALQRLALGAGYLAGGISGPLQEYRR